MRVVPCRQTRPNTASSIHGGDRLGGRFWFKFAVSGMVQATALSACLAQTPVAASHSGQTRQTEQVRERRTADYFESIKSNPPLLRAFLHDMPKGADLHNHISGSIYAESYVQWAAMSGLCIDQKTLALALGNCDPSVGKTPASAA